MNLLRTLLVLVVALSALPTVHTQERAAPPAPPQELDLPAIDDHIGWANDGAVFVDGARPKRALTKDEAAFDRGALIDAAVKRAQDEKKLVLWYVPRIVEQEKNGVQMYRAPILDLYCRQVLFCDADVAALIASRCVPVRAVCDEKMSERFDLRPLEVIEPMFVLIDGNGAVVERIDRVRTFDGLWFATWLREALAEHAPLEEARLASASPAELTSLGEWERALAALGTGDETRIERAGLLRRLRRGEEALALLPDEPAAQLERGRILNRLGRFDDARIALLGALRSDQADVHEELALALLSLGDESGALRRFALLAQRHPDTLAGRRASANVHVGRDELPMGAAFAGYQNVAYLPESAYGLGAKDTAWRGAPPTADELRTRAVHFLLRMQRDHGGFTDARYAYWPDSTITANTWVAVTALSARALLEHRDVAPEAIDAALLSAEAFLFDPARLNRGANEDVYADCYRLEYLARRAQLDEAARPLCEQRMREIVAAAAARQEDNGFFAHEYPNAFCTGAMLQAFIAVRAIGIHIDAGVLERGCDALLAARGSDGTYAYGGTASGESGSTLADAAARMPLCEAVLFELGRGDPAHLSFALDNFWEQLPRLEKVRRNDFHSDGELAGFFWSHGLYHTSATLRLLPPEVAAHHARRLFEVLQRTPELDGSFADSHEFGKSYGTAMALLVLANIR
jgi:tetratricopeptide (TPR) repeat protein